MLRPGDNDKLTRQVVIAAPRLTEDDRKEIIRQAAIACEKVHQEILNAISFYQLADPQLFASVYLMVFTRKSLEALLWEEIPNKDGD